MSLRATEKVSTIRGGGRGNQKVNQDEQVKGNIRSEKKNKHISFLMWISYYFRLIYFIEIMKVSRKLRWNVFYPPKNMCSLTN